MSTTSLRAHRDDADMAARAPSSGTSSRARGPSSESAQRSSDYYGAVARATAPARRRARPGRRRCRAGAVTSRTAADPLPVGAQPTARSTPAQTRAPSTDRRSARPAGTRKAKGPRRVRLAVARVDPWSVMKMSFLLSVALGIAGVILTAVLWMILSTMNVFTDIEGVLQSLQTTTADPFSIKDYVGFGRVVSLSIVIGVIDVILMTAIATVMAFLYNICSALVGGVQLTLTDD